MPKIKVQVPKCHYTQSSGTNIALVTQKNYITQHLDEKEHVQQNSKKRKD